MKCFSWYIIFYFTLIPMVNARPIEAENLTKECGDLELVAFADSLDLLNIQVNEKKVHYLADNLLHLYGDMDCPEIVRIKAAKANAYELDYAFDDAVEIYIDILSLSEKNGFHRENAWVRLSLARVYEHIDRSELAKQYLKEAKEIIDQYNFEKIRSRYFIRMASYTRIYEDDFQLAEEYAKEAVRLGELHGVDRSVADGYLILGGVGDEDKAIEYFLKSSAKFAEMGDFHGSIFQSLNAARIYRDDGDLNSAIELIEAAKPVVEQHPGSESQYYVTKIYISELEAIIYEELNEKDNLINSLKELNQYSRLHQGFVNQEKINQLVLDNAIAQEQEKVATAENQSRFLIYGLIFLSLILLILLRLFFLNKSKNRQIEDQSSTISNQYNELEGLYKYQGTLLSEVHHRIKNNLQLILSLLILQKSKLKVQSDDGILDMLSHRIRSISLIHEQLYNLKEFDKIDVGMYAEDLLRNFQALSTNHNMEIGHKIYKTQLNLETITPLGLIWSELISNSMKYNKNNSELKIYFELKKEEEIYTMHYYDNGVGYPDGQFNSSSSGMGFTIIQSLATQLGAASRAYNNAGAHFEMEFREKVISPL